ATYSFGGPWVEKNIFAHRMLFALMTSMAVAFNHDEPRWLRLFAFPFIPVSLIIILTAGSATVLVLSIISILVMVSVWLIWSGLRTVQHARSMGVCAILFGLGTVLLLIANSGPGALAENFLGMLGKDTTLTGRTMLWEAADRIVKERPWLGVGAEGFWMWGRGDANTLLELSHKAPGVRFSFHNSYYEVQVHLGYVGLVSMVGIVLWAGSNSLLGWLRSQDLARSFLLLITGSTIITSFTESTFYRVFDVGVTLVYIAAVMAVAERYRDRKPSVEPTYFGPPPGLQNRRILE
ncbi:MAG: O-antigen ligase family protein, partial [Pseudomonadota bacterium]